LGTLLAKDFEIGTISPRLTSEHPSIPHWSLWPCPLSPVSILLPRAKQPLRPCRCRDSLRWVYVLCAAASLYTRFCSISSTSVTSSSILHV
jgi:hypothetical protein